MEHVYKTYNVDSLILCREKRAELGRLSKHLERFSPLGGELETSANYECIIRFFHTVIQRIL